MRGRLLEHTHARTEFSKVNTSSAELALTFNNHKNDFLIATVTRHIGTCFESMDIKTNVFPVRTLWSDIVYVAMRCSRLYKQR